MGDRDDLVRILRDATVMRDLGPDYERLADAILAAGWVPKSRLALVRDSVRDVVLAMRAERDALAATVDRVRALCERYEADPNRHGTAIAVWKIRRALNGQEQR